MKRFVRVNFAWNKIRKYICKLLFEILNNLSFLYENPTVVILIDIQTLWRMMSVTSTN
jgi:hypothetical protein